MLQRTLCILILLGFIGSPLIGSNAIAAEKPAKQEAKAAKASEGPYYLTAPPEAVEKWRKLKFGLFIHWGPVSINGTEIGWSRNGPKHPGPDPPYPHVSKRDGIPAEVYDELYKKFNPTKFDPDEWVQIAKDSGMKYLVFTTKHCDGFCNFDSKYTDYKITSPECPYGKDIVKQIADACHKGGVIYGVYYSQPDWRHPDAFTENHDRYIEYLHNQVRELMTNYGEVGMLFFDGLRGKEPDWQGKKLISMCRELQPNIMINHRCGVRADLDQPEQKVGKMQTDRPWETCMTLCRQWSWRPNDKMKSLKECLDVLVRVVTGDGNLLFNVGPMPDGRIEPRQVERIREMGDWLKKYGESIYDTRGGPFRNGEWGGSTYRDNTIYVFILDGSKQLKLPAIDKKIVSSSLLTDGSVKVDQKADSLTIDVSPTNPDEPVTIIKLQLDGPASEAKVK